MTDPVSRRSALRLGVVALAVGVAGCQTSGVGSTDADGENGGVGDADETTPGPDADGEAASSQTGDGATDTSEGGDGTPMSGADAVAARRVASGFASPLGLEIPQAGRRFVVDQVGQVYLQEDGTLYDEPFLDIGDRLVDLRDGFDERGLLGLAFHPDFADNGRFFVRYSAPPREGTPSGYDHRFVLSEFRADPGAATADRDSERTILTIPEPQFNHNAGAVAFGPDGYLYVAVGDGGGAGDQGAGHVADYYEGVGGGNGQDVVENLLGSILRIDVDDRDGERNYAIPADNPLVGDEGLDEHYAWGFRNPWRMSFGPDGRLFVGDVGQGAWEEVDVVESGGNYGWNVTEGTHCFQSEDCPSESPRGRRLRDPVVEYPHGGEPVSGISVIGGYLYDGDELAGLDGQYVFADWRAEGRLFAAREREDGLWPTRVVDVRAESQFGPNVLAFGRDPDGELFVCTTARSGPGGESGAVFRLGSA
ncbi:MAG: PQQ-dependent sugar dehydrogenase [Haloarculaceae archaeon]